MEIKIMICFREKLCSTNNVTCVRRSKEESIIVTQIMLRGCAIVRSPILIASSTCYKLFSKCITDVCLWHLLLEYMQNHFPHRKVFQFIFYDINMT